MAICETAQSNGVHVSSNISIPARTQPSNEIIIGIIIEVIIEIILEIIIGVIAEILIGISIEIIIDTSFELDMFNSRSLKPAEISSYIQTCIKS